MGWLCKGAVQADSGAEVPGMGWCRWERYSSEQTLMTQEKEMLMVIMMYVCRRERWVPVDTWQE